MQQGMKKSAASGQAGGGQGWTQTQGRVLVLCQLYHGGAGFARGDKL